MKNSKLFVIGIDGGCWNLFDKFMHEGIMPNLKKVVHDSFTANLDSTIPPVTAPAWASFITGMYPGKHGVFDFARYQRGNYQTLLNNANTIDAKSLWRILSENGKTVGVINVPMTYPPEEVNGFIIPGFLSPGVSRQKLNMFPPDLSEEIASQIGEYRVYLPMSPKAILDSKGVEGFFQKCSEIVDIRQRTALYLYQKHHPDFFLVHFLMTDVVQHWFWHCIDETHPFYDEKDAPAVREYVFKFYQNVDQKIGDLIDSVLGSTDIIILSDHGFGPLYRSLYLNQWLSEKGLLKYDVRKRKLLKLIRKSIATLDFLNLRNRILPSGSKRVSLEKSLQHEFQIKWERTKAFASSGSIYGHIYLNLMDREAKGTVTPGQEFQDLLESISEELSSLTDPSTGTHIVDKVYKKEEIFSGEYVDISPDLLVKPKDGYAMFSQLGNVDVIIENRPWLENTGTHRQNGIVVLWGDKFRKDGKGLGTAKIVDLAPTILYLLGISIPRSMDGRVLEEAFKSSYLQANAPRYHSDLAYAKMKGETGYTEEEEELVKERLRDLGYLD